MARASTNPDFPCALESLWPGDILNAATTLEIGALYRLARAGWTRTPPCVLPSEEAYLRRIAQVGEAEWSGLDAMLRLATTPVDDGLLMVQARRVYDSLAERKRRLSSAGSRGSERRWGVGPAPPDGAAPHGQAIARLWPGHGQAISAENLRSESLQSVQRPRVHTAQKNSERPSDARAESAQVSDAWTLDAAAERVTRLEIRSALKRATFPTASDPRRRALPDKVIDDAAAAAMRFAGDEIYPPLMRVEHALYRVRALLAREPGCNPCGLILAALGAVRGKRAWEPTIDFAATWRSERSRAQDAAARILAMRQAKTLKFPETGAAS